MNSLGKRAFFQGRTPRRERGTMLIIALIVLVAMTLAGIATMRSVDTAIVMAGNIAFKQSALNAADQGIQAGYALLGTPTTNPAADLNHDGMNIGLAGYVSNAAPTEPNWSDPAAWLGAVTLNGGVPDAAGNVVSFIVHRMCTLANTQVGAGVQQCGSTVSTATLSKEGSDNFRAQDAGFASLPIVHYRITARAVGPRNSIAIVQTLLR